MKKKIIVGIFIILCFSIVFVLNRKKNNENLQENKVNIINYNSNNIDLIYNSEIKQYEIIDKTTGKVMKTIMSEDEAQYRLKFYKENPEYLYNEKYIIETPYENDNN